MTREPKAGPTAPAENPDHDRHAAGIYQAIACRFYCRYVDARKHAEFRGEDLPDAEPLITELEAGERYERAITKWINEPPASGDAVLALIELVGVIAADHLAGEAMREAAPVSEETDAYHQVLAVAAIGEWVNQIVTRQWLDRRTAVYGPTGLSSKEREVRP